MRGMWVPVALAISALAVSGTVWSEAEGEAAQALRAATASNTIPAYSAFVRRHPDSELADVAVSRIRELADSAIRSTRGWREGEYAIAGLSVDTVSLPAPGALTAEQQSALVKSAREYLEGYWGIGLKEAIVENKCYPVGAHVRQLTRGTMGVQYDVYITDILAAGARLERSEILYAAPWANANTGERCSYHQSYKLTKRSVVPLIPDFIHDGQRLEDPLALWMAPDGYIKLPLGSIRLLYVLASTNGLATHARMNWQGEILEVRLRPTIVMDIVVRRAPSS